MSYGLTAYTQEHSEEYLEWKKKFEQYKLRVQALDEETIEVEKKIIAFKSDTKDINTKNIKEIDDLLIKVTKLTYFTNEKEGYQLLSKYLSVERELDSELPTLTLIAGIRYISDPVKYEDLYELSKEIEKYRYSAINEKIDRLNKVRDLALSIQRSPSILKEIHTKLCEKEVTFSYSTFYKDKKYESSLYVGKLQIKPISHSRCADFPEDNYYLTGESKEKVYFHSFDGKTAFKDRCKIYFQIDEHQRCQCKVGRQVNQLKCKIKKLNKKTPQFMPTKNSKVITE